MKDSDHTVCNISVAAAHDHIKEYAETNYPLPVLVEIPSSDRKLCGKCAEITNKK